jgi:hypothetical protein
VFLPDSAAALLVWAGVMSATASIRFPLLKKLGCGSVLLGCVLPLLAFFGNSPVISWISLAAVSVGVLVYAGAFFADVSETLSNQAMQRVRNTIGPDEESNVTSR